MESETFEQMERRFKIAEATELYINALGMSREQQSGKRSREDCKRTTVRLKRCKRRSFESVHVRERGIGRHESKIEKISIECIGILQRGIFWNAGTRHGKHE